MRIFSLRHFRVVCAAAVMAAVTTTVNVSPVAAREAMSVPAGVPTAEDWRKHLVDDLMPFWVPAQVQGETGNFPTYRCDDGSQFNPEKPCPELEKPVGGIVYLDREYLRMKSRQVYGYSVAFHMTGDRKYLELARQGARYLMEKGFEKVDGRLVPLSFWQSGKGAPSLPQRTSQDMAYSLTGLGMYYYVTREPEVLTYLVAVKDYIFDTYHDKGQHIIRWINENFQDETTDKWELTAQLDQVYGYMIWLTPTLPAVVRKKWEADLVTVSRIMKDTFYAGDCATKPGPACGLFWGDATSTHHREVNTNHTDFGHSVKTMWMIYTVGKRYGLKDLEDFGREGAKRILDLAYEPATGSWLRAPGDANKEWWAVCELDQTAGSLALEEPRLANYLPSSFKYWREKFVDKQHGEVWHWVNADGSVDHRFPKQHAWKNMMHSTEHALVGYITASELHASPVKLYFSFKASDADRSTIHPYVYQATKVQIDAPNSDGTVTVTFSGIR